MPSDNLPGAAQDSADTVFPSAAVPRTVAVRAESVLPLHLGCYEVLELLGTGGWGDVHRARKDGTESYVALKVLRPAYAANPEFVERFRREARLISSLAHPNIVKVFEIGDDGALLYIAMELVEGQSLHQLVRRGPVPVAKALEIATQIAAGLAAAHDARIVHRDLKPKNVMVDNDGRVKIVDFGLGQQTPRRVLSSDTTVSPPPESETVTGTILGTVDYMSPQQARGERLDFRSDQFSFGTTMYEMVSGRRVFRRDTAAQTMAAIMEDEPERLAVRVPDIPEALEAIVHRCLAKAPDGRFASTNELWQELEATRLDQERPWTKSLPVALAMATKEVAVLPFVSIGTDPVNQPFCDGLVEVLTSKLSQLEQFQRTCRVVPAGEVRQHGVTSASDAARAFNVSLVVTGSVQRSTDAVRVTVNLIDAVRLRQLRTGSLDVDARQVSALQDGVVLETCRLLGLSLSRQEQQALATGGTTVPRAYDFYVQGKGYLQRYEEPGQVALAIRLFNRAIDEDPEYALACAGLGEACWRQYELSKEPGDLAQAREACGRALALNDKLAPVHVTLGTLHRTAGQYADSVQDLERALRIEPMNSDACRELATTYMAMGETAEAESTFRRAIAVRPGFWGAYNDLGGFYFRLGRYGDAEPQFQRALDLTPDNSRAYNNLGSIFYTQHRYAEAAAHFERAVELSPRKAMSYSNLGTVYFAQRRFADAARAFERAVAVNPRHYQVWRNLAAAYHWAPGEREKARDAFLRAAELAEAEHRLNPLNVRVLIHLADCYSMLGDPKRARVLLDAALRPTPPQDVSLIFNAGVVFEQIGQRDEALAWIGQALEHGYSRQLVEDSPSLTELRRDPRFAGLIQQD